MSSLADALGVSAGDVVAFVGAGGKTSSMNRLARELAGRGWTVVLTTTTHMWEPVFGQTDAIILAPDSAALLKQLPDLLRRFRVLTVASGYAEPAPSDLYRKLAGLSPSLVDEIAGLPGVDVLLVEADGARGGSLKAPAKHEPVVPSRTTLLVPVAAVDALGLPVAEPTVHRPAMVAELSGLRAGDPITPLAMATVLAHPQGGLKGRPSGSRVVPLLNKVEGTSRESLALQVARLLLRWTSIHHVVVGAVGAGSGPAAIWAIRRRDDASPLTVLAGPRVAAVVLAAGGARRFGGPKQLLTVAGQPMVARVTAAVLASQADDVLVVVGSRGGETVQALAGLPVRTVLNAGWEEGMASSMRVGLGQVSAGAGAALFVLADQITLTTKEVNAVIGAYALALAEGPSTYKIVAPVHQGRRGNPVLFDRSLFPELMMVEGDQGGRGVIRRHAGLVLEVEVPTGGVLSDLDTQEDVPSWVAAKERGSAYADSNSRDG
jgi:molybdenum cofactor cytidylyltransferase